jgi:glycosyltransferase involved in cell wall biosynthesis
MTSHSRSGAGDAGAPDRPSPLVSAVVTTYDRPSYLRRAVRSVLDQTYDEVELVVVDDHSETPARDHLGSVDLSGLTSFQCVRHGENRGANAARNTGIEAASGEYVAFLDDDDRWHPEKTERQVAALADAPEGVGAAYTGLETFHEDGREESIPPAVEGDLTKALLCENVVGSMSVFMVRTDLARAVPLDERFPCWADLEWYINLSRRTEFRRVAEPLVVYESDSHNRLTADIQKKRAGYELFVEEFTPLAREYGRLFARKMRGWAAYRLGASAYYRGYYPSARRYLSLSLRLYPFEPSFLVLFLAALGGKPVHRTVRFARELDL